MTGAALRDILGHSRDAKCCILQYKIFSKMGRVRSPKRRVRDDDFIVGLSSDYARIILGLSSNRLSIGGSIQGISAEILSFKISWQAQYLVRYDISYVTQIIDDIHFAWQAQYLVRLEGEFSWQAQHFVTFWEIAGARNVVFYNTKSCPRWEE